MRLDQKKKQKTAYTYMVLFAKAIVAFVFVFVTMRIGAVLF